MRVWEIGLPGDECGSCSNKLDGRPAQFISLDKVKRRLVRCEMCADGPVPERVAPARAASDFHPPSGLEAPQRLAFDEPAAAAVTRAERPTSKPIASLSSLREHVLQFDKRLRGGRR